MLSVVAQVAAHVGSRIARYYAADEVPVIIIDAYHYRSIRLVPVRGPAADLITVRILYISFIVGKGRSASDRPWAVGELLVESAVLDRYHMRSVAKDRRRI